MENTPCSWIRRLDIVNMAIHPKLTYRLSTTLFRISVTYS